MTLSSLIIIIVIGLLLINLLLVWSLVFQQFDHSAEREHRAITTGILFFITILFLMYIFNQL